MSALTYTDWMNLTKKRFHRRSPELKNVDRAFRRYDEQGKRPNDLQRLAKEFRIWVDIKAAGTRDAYHSIRNRKKGPEGFGPVERLQSLIRTAKMTNNAIVRDLQKDVADTLVMDTTLSSSLFHKNKVKETYNRSKKATSKAHNVVLNAGSPGAERDLFVRWFGAYSNTRKQVVLKNIRNLNRLFTSGVIIIKDATALPDAWGDCYGFAMRGNKKDFVEFSIGRAFFRKQGFYVAPGATRLERSQAARAALRQAYNNTSDWTVGTMIHELGHAVNDLPDINFQPPATYAEHPGMPPAGWDQVSTPALDLALAVHNPDLAVTNTDNYGQFCRECLET